MARKVLIRNNRMVGSHLEFLLKNTNQFIIGMWWRSPTDNVAHLWTC